MFLLRTCLMFLLRTCWKKDRTFITAGEKLIFLT